MSEFAKLLDVLGRDPGEHLSVSTIGADGIFTPKIVTVERCTSNRLADAEWNRYYGTGVLHPRVTTGRGLQIDVIGVRELYADLDVKPKGLSTLDIAHRVIDALSSMLGAEPVAIVNSGHGLQPHWALERSDATDWTDENDPRWLDAVALWHRWQRLIASVAEHYGGKIDGVFDLSRVLRIPGTTNTMKGPSVLVTVEWTGGAPASLERLAEVLDEYGIAELPEDREVLGEVVAPPSDWTFGSRTCGYVATMVAGWAMDRPEARHPWLMSQCIRLACAHRLQCITEHDHTQAMEKLAARFLWLLKATEPKRKPQPGEVQYALTWAAHRASTKTENQAHKELGDHKHLDDEGSDGIVPGFYFKDKVGLLAATLAEDVIAMGPLAEGADDLIWSYSSGVWTPDRDVVRNRAATLLGERYRRGHSSSVEDIVRTRSPNITCDPVSEVINFRNGLYLWQADQLQDHDPRALSTVQLAVDWNPEATCPDFDRFLGEVVPEDMVPVVWEAIGYLLYSGNPLHKALMLMGSGRNGKGTLLRVLVSLLGAHNITAVSLHTLVSTRFATAGLFGKIANIAGDIDGTYLESTATFKAITGQDQITAEHKGRKAFDFTPWAVPVFSANKIPASADVTTGYLSRWLILPFPNDFTGKEDRKLDKRLHTKAELQGVAAKAMPHLRRLMERGDFDLPESGQEARDEFTRRVDQVRTWVTECCELTDHHTQPRTWLYRQYKAWAERDGHRPVKAREFYDRLDTVPGVRPTRRHGGERCYEGLKVVGDGDSWLPG